MSKESARVRMLKLCYYLVDDSIDLIEEKEMNSGILQGPFIKRRKVKDFILRVSFLYYRSSMILSELQKTRLTLTSRTFL